MGEPAQSREAAARLVDRIERDVVAGLDAGERVTPSALLFLLRLYIGFGRADLEERLEVALARALELQESAGDLPDLAAWLTTFAEASQVSSDERIGDAVAALVERVSSGWGSDRDVQASGRSIEACLRAALVVELSPIVPRAIDELERLVGLAYRPGHGVGSASSAVRLASALLAAFSVTARLPYAMLADEIVLAMRRSAWDRAARLFRAPFEVNCDAVRVLSRLTALHADPEYRRTAVLAPGDEYDCDADGILCALEPQLSPESVDVALYGLALVERGLS